MNRKRISNKISIAFLFALTLLVFTSTTSAKDAVELNSRGGFNHLAKRIINKDNAVIGFFGGSITEAENGWRSRTMNWFRTNYPDVKFREVNAAIGGTNSKYGAYRLERHLLDSAQFDLIFIEFSVNDWSTPKDTTIVYRCMEGIIRQIKSKYPKADICMIYTISEQGFEAVKQRKLTLAASTHDKLAEYYNIPSLFFGYEVLNKINSGEAVFKDKITDKSSDKNEKGQFVFAEDGTHPGNYGHGLYENVMRRSLPVLLQNKVPTKCKMPKPLRMDNYQHATMYPLQIKYNHGMQFLTTQRIPDSLHFLKPVIQPKQNYLFSSQPSAYYKFTFSGTEIGISCIYGKYTGNVIIEVDGKPFEYKAFDRFCVFFNRRNFIFHSCEPGVHKVRIYTGKPITVEEKKAIIGNEYFKDDSLYLKNDLIFSDVMVNGQILE